MSGEEWISVAKKHTHGNYSDSLAPSPSAYRPIVHSPRQIPQRTCSLEPARDSTHSLCIHSHGTHKPRGTHNIIIILVLASSAYASRIELKVGDARIALSTFSKSGL